MSSCIRLCLAGQDEYLDILTTGTTVNALAQNNGQLHHISTVKNKESFRMQEICHSNKRDVIQFSQFLRFHQIKIPITQALNQHMAIRTARE